MNAPTLHSDPQRIIHKVRWTLQEDLRLLAAVNRVGHSNWRIVSEAMCGRTGKQCRERWLNHLSPFVNHETWTPQEDLILMQSQNVSGNSWASIAQLLPGRSASNVKNRWAYLCRREGEDQRTVVEPVMREIRFPVLEGIPAMESESQGERSDWGSKG
jgi:hypothetical protein